TARRCGDRRDRSSPPERRRWTRSTSAWRAVSSSSPSPLLRFRWRATSRKRAQAGRFEPLRERSRLDPVFIVRGPERLDRGHVGGLERGGILLDRRAILLERAVRLLGVDEGVAERGVERGIGAGLRSVLLELRDHLGRLTLAHERPGIARSVRE